MCGLDLDPALIRAANAALRGSGGVAPTAPSGPAKRARSAGPRRRLADRAPGAGSGGASAAPRPPVRFLCENIATEPHSHRGAYDTITW